MRGFHSEEEPSKVVTQKTIEEYAKIITRESFLKNYPYAFSIALEALEIYGGVPQIIQLARDLIDKDVKSVMYFVPKERKIATHGWWCEFRCNKKYGITDDWIIDTAIAWGFKNIRREAICICNKKTEGREIKKEYVLIGSFFCNNGYAITQTQTQTTVEVYSIQQKKMLKAIGYGLINLAIQESKK